LLTNYIQKSLGAEMGYMYKATFRDGAFGVNGRPYWLLTSTGEFQNKLVSRGKLLKEYLKQYGDDDISIEFIQPIESKSEANILIAPHLRDPLCLNCLNYKGNKGKRGQLTKEKRQQFQTKYRMTKISKAKAELMNAGKLLTFSTGKRRKEFNSFEAFYKFIKNEQIWLEMSLFNFESQVIESWFRLFYNTKGHTNKRDIEKYFACKTEQCSKIDFWLERGWSKDEASKRVSEIQNKPNKLKFSMASGMVFNKFYDEYSKMGFTCYIHSGLRSNSHEYCLYDETFKRTYLYDFCIKELGLIFEYDGEHVHPNPSWSKEKLAKWKSPYSDCSANEVLEKTKRKYEIANKRGFKVVDIWSSTSVAKNRIIVEAEIEHAIYLHKNQPNRIANYKLVA
jgi:hypothetical protein